MMEIFASIFRQIWGMMSTGEIYFPLKCPLNQFLFSYNATLGHKVNHSFQPNSEFVLFSAHPVLGTIMGLTALNDLPAFTEVSVNYGYNFTTEPDQPQWFKDLWEEFVLQTYVDHEEL